MNSQEKKLRAMIDEWRRKNSSRHSAAFKSSYYMDSSNSRYDWRASEARRQEIKKMLERR